MTDISELLKQIPIGDIATKFGVSKEDAEAAVKTALPTLLSGLQANAASGGSASLEKALSKHNNNLLEGGVKLDDIDEADGEKIVNNVFGAKKKEVVSAVESKAVESNSVVSGLVSKVLPILAPIVLTFLATKFFGGSKEEKKTESASGNPLEGLLGGLLGGGSGSGGGGFDLGGLVGGFLGGGDSKDKKDSGGGFDLGSLIGGFLGGGKK